MPSKQRHNVIFINFQDLYLKSSIWLNFNIIYNNNLLQVSKENIFEIYERLFKVICKMI